MSTVQRLTESFLGAVKEAGGRCVFVGAIATSIWGIPRYSQDVDVILLIDEEQIPRLVSALHKRSLQTTAFDMTEGLRQRSHVTVRDSRTSDAWLDVKFADSEEERREVLHSVVVGRIPISPIEETIAYKILFGSPKDLTDVQGIIEVRRGAIDERRLRSLMAGLGLSYRTYERLKKQADPRRE